MNTLHEFPPTRSQRPKWALEEIGADYTSNLVNLQDGKHKSDNYLALHPLGTVPAYEGDGYTLLESVAIVMQLLDEHSSNALAPKPGSAERAMYYQWCIFGPAELDELLFTVTQNELFLPEDKRNITAANQARVRFAARATMLSDTLQNQDYLLGSQFSGADIVIGYNCFWATFTGLLDDYPVLQAYLGKLVERPAFQRAFPPSPG